MSKLPSYQRIDDLGHTTAKFATCAILAVMLALFFWAIGGWAIAKPLLILGGAGIFLSGLVFRRLLSLQDAKMREFIMSYRRSDYLLGLN